MPDSIPVSPESPSRLVQILAPAPSNVEVAKRLMAETILRNATPTREFLHESPDDLTSGQGHGANWAALVEGHPLDGVVIFVMSV